MVIYDCILWYLVSTRPHSRKSALFSTDACTHAKIVIMQFVDTVLFGGVASEPPYSGGLAPETRTRRNPKDNPGIGTLGG